MKNLKIAAISSFLILVMMSMSYADNIKRNPSRKVVHISFLKAVQSPGLVNAMHQQLDGSFLSVNQSTYTAQVYFQNTFIRITGSFNQWLVFFGNDVTKSGSKTGKKYDN